MTDEPHRQEETVPTATGCESQSPMWAPLNEEHSVRFPLLNGLYLYRACVESQWSILLDVQ